MELSEKLICQAPEVSETGLFRIVADLCAIGSRWPGDAGEARAMEYLLDAMTPLADTVSVEEFDYPHYTPIRSRVTVIRPDRRPIGSIGLEYSGIGTVRGQLAYAGEGSEADFQLLTGAGAELEGKVILSRTNRPYIVASHASAAKAAGILIISDSPFGTIRQMSSQLGFRDGEDLLAFGTPVPGAIIDRKSGEYLLSLLSAGAVEVGIEHQSVVDMRRSWNVIGTLPGSGQREEREEEVVIGAHYDTQRDIDGAWDNASGCAALLEILRACSKAKAKRTMRFCAFGCEEIGLFGSTNYVRKRVRDLDKILCYVNLDSTSADVCYTHELLATKRMLDFALEIIRGKTNWKITQFREFVPLDHEQDSAEFVKCGVDAIWAHEEGNAFFHTGYDTLETISPAKLARATRVALLPFYYLANCDKVEFTG